MNNPLSRPNTSSIAPKIEEEFQKLGYELMISKKKREFSKEEFAACQSRLDELARYWFYETLKHGYEYDDLDEWRDTYCDFSQIQSIH